ncbi:MAG: hypothetical protein HUU01_09660 [Saprospiraceae bacterium]|nr:hypothetical protein [Saprospiraceae bacterium]
MRPLPIRMPQGINHYLLPIVIIASLAQHTEAAGMTAQSGSVQPEPCPYILYWGGLEARFTADKNGEGYSSELNLSPEAVWEAIKREPRLWDGETLQEQLVLEVNGILVTSDYTRPEIYQACLKPLQDVVKSLKEGDRMVIEKIIFPGGKYGRVILIIGSSELQPEPKMFRYGVSGITWGKNWFTQGEKRFMTTAEFWDMLLSEPQIAYTNQTYRKLDQWNVGIFIYNSPVLRLRAERNDALNFSQLRERLEQEFENIKPGAKVLFSTWGLLDEAPKHELDTFQFYDPSTGGKTSVRVYPGSRQLFGSISEEVLTCRIIGSDDPRRFLKPEDQHTYQIKWDAFSENMPESVFGQAYYTPDEESLLHADNQMTLWNNRFTKKEIIGMLRQKPELFRSKELITDLDFILSYKGRDYSSAYGQTPADLLKKLERELKSGDVIRISGIRARANPGRYVVGFATELKNHKELESKIQTAEALDVVNSGEKQQVLRLNLTASEFEALRPKLEKIPGIWLQQGDIDLTPFSLDLEVRDDDHKPTLPAKKKQ